jgi:hypothetical protein
LASSESGSPQEDTALQQTLLDVLLDNNVSSPRRRDLPLTCRISLRQTPASLVINQTSRGTSISSGRCPSRDRRRYLVERPLSSYAFLAMRRPQLRPLPIWLAYTTPRGGMAEGLLCHFLGCGLAQRVTCSSFDCVLYESNEWMHLPPCFTELPRSHAGEAMRLQSYDTDRV